MILDWRDQILVSDARGSNGFQYLVYAGAPMAVIKQIPATGPDSSPYVQKDIGVGSLEEGKELAQTWEDEEAAKWDAGIWE